VGLIVAGATILDGVSDTPVVGKSIWIENGRIKAIARPEELGTPITPSVQRIEVRGKHVIPGLMNANVHLLAGAMLPGTLVQCFDCLEDVAAEAAQVALKNGLTTVFDTMGPRKPLVSLRDRINAGSVPGSRFYCAGWIVGLDGIFSRDFIPAATEVFSAHLVERVNSLCAENVGPALTWMTPEQVAQEVRTYIGKGIDFVKYASSEHRWADPTTTLVFSPRVQAAIVEEAHRAGLTAQAHTIAPESLHVAVEAGCDVIQHCNITGPFPLPESTLELIARRKTGAVIFPFTRRRFEWIMANSPNDRAYKTTMNANCRRLLDAGALLMLANDGSLWGPDLLTDPKFAKSWFAPGEDDLSALDQGHFVWFKAMEEMGMRPMEMLKAATRNIAVAYKKDKDLGTLEPGKLADLVILDRDPLQSAENYRAIHMVIKGGDIVDRDALPLHPILTRPVEPPSEETRAHRRHRHIGRSGFPACPLCQ
jgi:imidazolonepropionase-like amidohydrolase